MRFAAEKGITEMNTGFWIFMLGCALLTPITMAIIGRAFIKHPPKKINDFYGYRTQRSQQSPEAWKFAHEYCGKIWWIAGLIMIPLTAAGMLLFFGSDIDTIGIAGGVIVCVQAVAMCLLLIPVEAALKQKFGK